MEMLFKDREREGSDKQEAEYGINNNSNDTYHTFKSIAEHGHSGRKEGDNDGDGGCIEEESGRTR